MEASISFPIVNYMIIQQLQLHIKNYKNKMRLVQVFSTISLNLQTLLNLKIANLIINQTYFHFSRPSPSNPFSNYFPYPQSPSFFISFLLNIHLLIFRVTLTFPIRHPKYLRPFKKTIFFKSRLTNLQYGHKPNIVYCDIQREHIVNFFEQQLRR